MFRYSPKYETQKSVVVLDSINLCFCSLSMQYFCIHMIQKHAHASSSKSTIANIRRDCATWVDACESRVEPAVDESGKLVTVFNRLKFIMIVFLFRWDNRRTPPPHCTYHTWGSVWVLLVCAAITSSRGVVNKWKRTHTTIKVIIIMMTNE